MIFEISTFTGAPAALALALGFQDDTKGVMMPTTPTALMTDVAPTKNFRRAVAGFSGCSDPVTTASVMAGPLKTTQSE
jgi:hypothetical protein